MSALLKPNPPNEKAGTCDSNTDGTSHVSPDMVFTRKLDLSSMAER